MDEGDWTVAGAKKSSKRPLSQENFPKASEAAKLSQLRILKRDASQDKFRTSNNKPPPSKLTAAKKGKNEDGHDVSANKQASSELTSHRRERLRRNYEAKFNDPSAFPSLPSKSAASLSSHQPTSSRAVLSNASSPSPHMPTTTDARKPKLEVMPSPVETQVEATQIEQQETIPTQNAKPKKLSLFDIILQKGAAKKQQQKAPPPTQPVTVVPEASIKKKKKNAKKLSILKKRILSERLKHHSSNLSQSNATSEFYIVSLEHFVSSDDIVDSEERQEILSSLIELLSAVGTPYSIRFRHDDAAVVVDIVYSDITAASRTVTALDGNVFSGSTVSATLLGYDIPTSVAEASSSTQPQEVIVLELRNIISDGDLDDEDEKKEVYHDIYTLCGAYGRVSTIVAQKSHEMLLTPLLLPAIKISSSFVDVSPKCAMLHYDSFLSALSAYRRLQRCIVGGVQLSCFMYDLTSNDRAVYVPQAAVNLTNGVLGIRCCDSAVVTLSEFRNKIIASLQNPVITSSCASILQKMLRKKLCTISSRNSSVTLIAPIAQSEFTALILCGVDAELYSLRSEGAGCHALLLSSPSLGCIVGVSDYIDEDFDSHPLYFPEESLAVKRDLVQLANARGCKRVSIVDWQQSAESNIRVFASYSSYAGAFEAMLNLDGSVIAGSHVFATLHWTGIAPTDDIIPSTGETLTIENESTQGRGPIIVNRKQLLSTTPKQPKHTAPSKPIPVLSDALNEKVKELCSSLATFQQRAKEKDPLNAKRKERFLLGIKQAINCVKSGRARLLLLAPDTEESDTLDSKLDVLVQEARMKEIPLAYSLRRRALGKAVQSSMRQSVVTIVNPDGAHEAFKFIITALSESKNSA